MTRDRPDNPLLSPEEIVRVLGRAARLEAASESDRLTAHEVLDIAREAGIDEAAARRALSDVLAERVSAGRGLLGVQVHFAAHADVPRSIEQNELAALADVLRLRRRVSGTARIEGGELVWRDAEGARVTVMARGEVTRVSASASLGALSQSSLALFSVGGMLGAVYAARLLGLPAAEAKIAAIAAGVGVGVGGWSFYWKWKARVWRARLGAIVALLRDEIETRGDPGQR